VLSRAGYTVKGLLEFGVLFRIESLGLHGGLLVTLALCEKRSHMACDFREVGPACITTRGLGVLSLRGVNIFDG